MSKIKIVSWKGDVPALRACVASIRYWYPDVTIELYKDTARGNFDLTEFVVKFNCVEKNLKRKYGSPLSKLELLLTEEKEKYLLLDPDCIFAGRVFDTLNQSEDITVSADPQDDTASQWFTETYYNHEALLEKFDRDFVFPGYSFNTGQMFCTSGILSERDFDSVIDWSAERPCVRNPEIFALADQGVLNYILPALAAEGRISITRQKFHLWPVTEHPLHHAFARENQPTLDDIKKRDSKCPYVVHWAGLVRRDSFEHTLKVLPWGYLLQFFEDLYFSKTSHLRGHRLKFKRFLNRFRGAINRRILQKWKV